MIDQQLARLRTHRSNIQRYRNLLQTSLTELEREFVEQRLTEEQSNLESLTNSLPNVVILRPAYPNGILLFEIPNRRRRLISAWFDNRSIQGSVRLDQADDAGRGFLLSQGYTLVWAGWQADAPAGAGLLSIQVPVVAGITGPVRQEWSFGDTTNPHPQHCAIRRGPGERAIVGACPRQRSAPKPTRAQVQLHRQHDDRDRAPVRLDPGCAVRNDLHGARSQGVRHGPGRDP